MAFCFGAHVFIIYSSIVKCKICKAYILFEKYIWIGRYWYCYSSWSHAKRSDIQSKVWTAFCSCGMFYLFSLARPINILWFRLPILKNIGYLRWSENIFSFFFAWHSQWALYMYLEQELWQSFFNYWNWHPIALFGLNFSLQIYMELNGHLITMGSECHQLALCANQIETLTSPPGIPPGIWFLTF